MIPVLALVVLGAWPDTAAAQRRAVRRVPQRHLIVRGGIYGPAFFNPWYRYGYGPWYPYQYQWGYPYPPYGYARYDDLTASVRLEVTPNTAEVYVDGYRAGTVDDFDGFFQRLRVRPGEHELVLYLDGYRTVRQNLYLNFRADQKIRYTMVPLPPGEQAEPRPQPMEVAPEELDVQPAPPAPRPRGVPGRGPGQGGLPPPQPGAIPDSQYGSISIRVQPADAEVLIDGERWSAPAGQERLVVQLSGGRHHVEIRKDGYDSYAGDVDVRAGDTVPLNVSLLRRE
jgi:hypothetical protein